MTGDHVIDTPLAPAVIDVEASGFGRGSYPIEVGYVLPDGRSDCMLIRPDDRWVHWDREAEALHGIARPLLLRYGRTATDVVERLDRALAGRIVYSDGWGNDLSWLSMLYDVAGRTFAFRLESLHTLLSEAQLAHWDRVKADVVREHPAARHRASADARTLQRTVVRLSSPHPT